MGTLLKNVVCRVKTFLDNQNLSIFYLHLTANIFYSYKNNDWNKSETKIF